MSALSLITCTGGRPEAFGLLEGWLGGQCFYDDIQWIVVDDVEQPTAACFGQTVLRPKPFWRPGAGHTLARNLLAALEVAEHSKILFLEDDEAYLPNYLRNMDAMLDASPLAGQMNCRYYHVGTRQYRTIINRQHASLCQTGITRAMIPRLQEICRAGDIGIDCRLWQASGALSHESDVVSLKGLPGRPGIGIGHRPGGGSWQHDADGSVLADWLGSYGAGKYAKFAV